MSDEPDVATLASHHEEWFRVTLASIGDGVIAADADGAVTYLNSVAGQLTGWTSEEAIGRPMREVFRIVNETTRREVENPAFRVLREGVVIGLANHTTLISRSGAEYHIDDSAAPIRDESGRVLGVVLVFRDITGKRLAEKRLEESEERRRLMVEAVKDYAIFMLDPDGNVVTWNTGAQRFKGYSPEEIIGRHFSTFYPPEDVARGKPEWELAVAAREGRIEDEGWRVRKDGTRFWANVVITALFDRQGKLRGFGKVTRDLTERKAAEDRVRRLNEELEQRVGERTAELTEANHRLEDEVARRRGVQDELLAEKRKLEAALDEIRRLNADLERRVQERTAQLTAANRELEAFCYSVSHDLRSPLRAVDGFSRILIEDHAPGMGPEVGRYLKLVRDNAQFMGRLIDDLLAFSRLGRQAMARRSVSPEEIVRQAAADLRVEQAGRTVELRIGELPGCEADPALLRQVFTNLLSNALKFTRKRDRAVIEVGAARDGNGSVTYFIRDNGVGFDMQYAGKLFGVFQRLHRAGEFEGTGVGLALVQRIILRHGGRIWAEAAPDKGATFHFTLPKGGDRDNR